MGGDYRDAQALEQETRRERAQAKRKAPGATARGMGELDSLAARVHRHSVEAV